MRLSELFWLLNWSDRGTNLHPTASGWCICNTQMTSEYLHPVRLSSSMSFSHEFEFQITVSKYIDTVA